jgi:hypothetical protein
MFIVIWGHSLRTVAVFAREIPRLRKSLLFTMIRLDFAGEFRRQRSKYNEPGAARPHFG